MVTKDEARRYLNDCAPEHSFWVNNGQILKNLDDLSSILLELNDDIFQHHVNHDKNDFSNWVRDIVGDKKLANGIISSKNKESMAKKVMARVSALKKKAS